MNRRHFFTASATAAVLLSLAAPRIVEAQGNFGAGGGRAFGRFPGAQNANGPIDPLRSYSMTLLFRNDVRSLVRVTSRQREQIEALKTQSDTDLTQQMQAGFQKIAPNFQNMRNLSAQDRQTQMQDFRGKMQETVKTTLDAVQGDTDKKTAAILTPDQMKRLHQLDLQWRGPLSLGDPKVADELNLTPDQRTAATTAAEAYNKAVQQATQDGMRTIWGGMGRGGRGGANAAPNAAAPPATGAGTAAPAPNAPANPNAAAATPAPAPVRLTPQQMQEAMQKMQETLKTDADKKRKAAGEKLLNALGADVQQRWITAQGRPFTFRIID